MEKAEQVKNCLCKPLMSSLNTRTPVSENKMEKMKKRSWLQYSWQSKSKPKLSSWREAAESLKQGDLGADVCSSGSTTSARRACSQLPLLLLMWSWSGLPLDRRIWELPWCLLSYTPSALKDNVRPGIVAPFQMCLDFSFKHRMEKLQGGGKWSLNTFIIEYGL